MAKSELISMLADDRRSVSYRPRLNALTGSVTATILFQQILYWWDKNNQQPFYKFAAPCDHPDYKEGDSWQEELGFSRKELETAREGIAKKVNRNTKAEVFPQTLIAYWTNSDRRTYYEVNEELVHKKLAEIYAEPQKSTLRNETNSHYVTPESDITIQSETTTENTSCADAIAPPVRERKNGNDGGKSGLASVVPPAPSEERKKSAAPADRRTPAQKAVAACQAALKAAGSDYLIAGADLRHIKTAALDGALPPPGELAKAFVWTAERMGNEHVSGIMKDKGGHPSLTFFRVMDRYNELKVMMERQEQRASARGASVDVDNLPQSHKPRTVEENMDEIKRSVRLRPQHIKWRLESLYQRDGAKMAADCGLTLSELRDLFDTAPDLKGLI